MLNTQQKIRVLIVEDTLVGQGLLKGLLADDQTFEVVGIAQNGKQAVEFVARYLPDVVSMDIYMPIMDGVEATRLIMQNTPVPIVIVSSFYNASEIKMSFSILEAGALTILPRPFGPGHPQYTQTARNYRNTLKMMSGVKVQARRAGTAAPLSTLRQTGGATASLSALEKPGASAPLSALGKPDTERSRSVLGKPDTERSRSVHPVKVIAIGASAGGPQAIQTILNEIPKDIPVPILIVQHIDAHFAEGYCDWLNTTSNLPVHIASDGDLMLPGHVYLAPGDHHLGVKQNGVIALSKDSPEKGLRPAVSFLFRQVNAIYGKNSICILLSGMGIDGANDLKVLHNTGAFTIAQDEQSALVHGMPGEAIRLGGVSKVLSPEEITLEIISIFNNQNT